MEMVAQFSLNPGEHTVGRDNNNTVSAQSDYLSRHHAKLKISPDGISIEDLGSTHGTFVNGVAIQGITSIILNQPVQIGDLFLTAQDDVASNGAQDLYTTGDMIGDGRYTLRQEIGRGGAGSFVELVVQNQSRVGLGNAKQQRRRQEEAKQKRKGVQVWVCHHLH